MLEGQALPHDTHFYNYRGKIVDTRVIFIDPQSMYQADAVW